jgi:hypothetical protein
VVGNTGDRAGGAGIHSTTFNFKTRPASGYSWFDTGSQEERSLINDRESGFAFALGAGVDIYLTKAIFLGLEGRLTHLGEATYNSSTNTAFYSSLAGVKGSFSQANFVARMGYRFGHAANGTDAETSASAAVSTSTASRVSTTCPFQVSADQKIRAQLKSGKTTHGKVLSCDAEIKIRSGMFVWTYPSDNIARVETDH